MHGRGWVLAAMALGLALGAGCADAAPVTLESLAFDTEAHEGDEVVTMGTVVEFTEEDGATERHLVIEDERQNRVRLLPSAAAEPYIGADVQVTGRFSFDPGRGRILQVEEIREARADG